MATKDKIVNLEDLKVSHDDLDGKVSDLKSDLLKITGQIGLSNWVDGKYIALNVSDGSTINLNAPGTSSNYKYTTFECSEGDAFIINGTGGSASRLYGFLDSDNKLIDKAVANTTLSNGLIIAPKNSALIIVNVGINETDRSWYLGQRKKPLIEEIGTSKYNVTPVVKTSTVISWKNTEQSSNDYVCTDYVRTSGDATTVSLYCTVYAQTAALLFYDTDKKLLLAIDSQNASDYGISTSSTTPRNVVVDMPIGTAFIRANMRSTYYIDADTFNIVFSNNRTIKKTITDNAYEITSNKSEYHENELEALRSKFDSSFNWIAYSNIQGSGMSINTLEHFEWCAKKPVFKSIKADMQLTSDGKIILCHDDGFTLDQNGKVTTFDANNCTLIHDMTYAECVALQHAGTDQHVCGIDAVLKTCKKYGKNLYITLRNNYYQDTFDALLPLLKQYNFESNTIINAYPQNDEKCNYIRSKSTKISICYTCSANVNQFAKAVNTCIGLGNCILAPFSFNGGTVDIINTLAPIQSSIDRAKENGVRVYAAIMYQDNATSDLLQCGIVGAQTYILPTDIET